MTTQSHNPDNLTEWGQSEGWRLLTVEERSNPLPMDTQFFSRVERDWRASGQRGEVSDSNVTYRTREPLPSQPDDDLSYYETVLPAVIAGVRRGEKWEATFQELDDYYSPNDQSLKGILRHIGKRRVRLAPVPVVKLWNCIDDFPLNAYWLRDRDTGNVYRIDGCTTKGVVYASSGNWPKVMRWDELERFDWSPMCDIWNWHPCVKPEGGK